MRGIWIKLVDLLTFSLLEKRLLHIEFTQREQLVQELKPVTLRVIEDFCGYSVFLFESAGWLDLSIWEIICDQASSLCLLLQQ